LTEEEGNYSDIARTRCIGDEFMAENDGWPCPASHDDHNSLHEWLLVRQWADLHCPIQISCSSHICVSSTATYDVLVTQTSTSDFDKSTIYTEKCFVQEV